MTGGYGFLYLIFNIYLTWKALHYINKISIFAIYLISNLNFMTMNKILRLTFMAVLSLICGAGFAQTTFNFTALYGDATISDISGMPQVVDGVTVSFAKGNSQNAPAYNKAGEVRLYGGSSATVLDGCTMTFTSTAGNMQTITLEHGSNGTWGTMTANVGTLSEDEDKNITWTGDAAEVVFTASRNVADPTKATQNRYKSAVVTLKGGVTKKAAGLAFSETSVSVEQGTSFNAPTFTKETTAPVTFTSDNEGVASVNSEGTITLGGELGTAVITASSEENDEYYAGSATCEIEVFVYNNYKKVAAVTSGKEYLIVAQRDGETYYAYPLSETYTYGYLSSGTVDGLQDEIKVKSTYDDGFVFTESGTGYTIQDCYGRYLYQKGDYNSFNVSDEPSVWNVEPQADGTFKIEQNGYFVQWGDGTYTTFGVYTEQDNNRVLPFLYELEEVGSGVSKVTVDGEDANAPVYNLAGQRVSKDAKGILIQNGKKFVNK